jgi:VWFA-related protein
MRPWEPICRLLVLCLCIFLSGAPSAPAQTTPSSQIEINVNRVFLSVVVRDKQGRAVSDLKQEDFQVLDNDKPEVVSAFTVQKHVPLENKPPAGPASSTPGVPPPAAPLPSPSPAPQRFVVFIFDDMHLSVEDLAAAKTAGVQALTEALVDPDMAAIVSTSGKVNSGLTRDRAALKAAVLSLQPRNVYRSSHLDCPDISYYQADLIVNKHDEPAFQDATRQELGCNPGIDVKDINIAERQADSDARRALNLGDLDVLTTYAALLEYARRMARLPGERLLILVSPGFITLAPMALTQESRLIDVAAQSNITISALDARGLYTTELEASEHSPSLRDLNGSGGSTQLQADYRRSGMALAEGAMASLADGTGGTFFHNRNDLGTGLVGLTSVPECVYLLEFSPSNVKPDGTYHHLKVKVNRDGVQIEARRGYYAPKPDKKK